MPTCTRPVSPQQEETDLSRTRIIFRGEVKEFQLEIPDFLSLSETEYLWSDFLPFIGEKWTFGISPGTFNGNFPIVIERDESSTLCSVVLSIGVKKENGQVEDVLGRLNLTYLRYEHLRYFLCPSLSRNTLEQRRSELLPSGVLTLVCTLRKEDPENDTTAEAAAPCQQSSSEGSANSVEASKQTQAENCIDKLSNDLNDLMLSGDESDFIVKVKGEEFRLHRNILGARTPAFRSMLRNDMREKTTGVVCIDDCEPETFRAFVRYVYSGRIDQLSTDTVFSLFVLADKYLVDDLKNACLCFIQRTISVDTFCDVLTLSLTYGLRDLLTQATDYFAKNTSAIIQTVKWMNFMTKKPIEANELHLKALSKNNIK